MSQASTESETRNIFSDQSFNQSIFVENFENDKNHHHPTSKEEIATRATAIIINGDLGSLSEKICGVYRAAKGKSGRIQDFFEICPKMNQSTKLQHDPLKRSTKFVYQRR